MRLAYLESPDGEKRIGLVEEDTIRLLDLEQVESCRNLSDILHHAKPTELAKFLVDTSASPMPLSEAVLRAPIDRQEIWAAGVTYKRSQVARMEESESGASHYDKVYSAARPELFLKATPDRVAGPGQPVRVRADSSWSVPEPELALFVTPDLRLAGYTVGNDMSARDIEGENPLYLPQAKVYRQCCGLGPAVLLAESPLDLAATGIRLSIVRAAEEVFCGSTDLSQLNRTFDDLIGWLGRENEFPHGAVLLTGTGIIPHDDFSLEDGDIVSIEIDGIGTLTNPVVKDAD